MTEQKTDLSKKMVFVQHILTCENCGFEESTADPNFGIDDILEFRYNCNNDECEMEMCQNCSNNCDICNCVYCDDCHKEHENNCTHINAEIEEIEN